MILLSATPVLTPVLWELLLVKGLCFRLTLCIVNDSEEIGNAHMIRHCGNAAPKYDLLQYANTLQNCQQCATPLKMLTA